MPALICRLATYSSELRLQYLTPFQLCQNLHTSRTSKPVKTLNMTREERFHKKLGFPEWAEIVVIVPWFHGWPYKQILREEARPISIGNALRIQATQSFAWVFSVTLSDV